MKRSTKSSQLGSHSSRKPKPTGKPTAAKSTAKKAPPSNTVASSPKKPATLTSTSELDVQLVRLLAERVKATQAELRADANSPAPPLWQLHETAVAATAKVGEELGLDNARLAEWIKHIVSLSYEQAHVIEPIAYLGPMYSYSFLAATKHFGMAAHLVPVATIAAVFDELIRGQATFGVVPIENSTDGRVVDTLGMFARLPVKICGEVLLPVHHCLLGRCRAAKL